MVILVLSLFLSFNLYAAESCQLDSGEVLRIGCTWNCKESYVKALEKTAGQLGYRFKMVDLRYPHSEVDGVLTPGGHDIQPKYYTGVLSEERASEVRSRYARLGKTCNSCKNRDAFEYKYFSEYFSDSSNKTPVLGVCYGMQMLSVVNKLPLYVDIKEELGIPNRYKLYDKVNLSGYSIVPEHFQDFHAKLDQTEKSGYESHHQGLHMGYYRENRHKTDMVVVGTSNDAKIAEVIYHKTKPAMGVQFHPEVSGKSPKIKKEVYGWLLEAACRKKKGL